jgi:hypothetical protein
MEDMFGTTVAKPSNQNKRRNIKILHNKATIC